MSDERGEMGLMQILLAAALMIGILGATLSVFTTAERVNRDDNSRIDSQERARSALDQMAAQLRNLASPTAEEPRSVDQAGPYDLVFVTVDRVGPNAGLNAANLMRVRYCLGTADTTALYRQQQRWTSQATPAPPATATCPAAPSSTGWSATTVLSQGIVNRRSGLERPVFAYNAAAPGDVFSIHAQLFVDADPASGPPETVLSSGVFLRNQNRRPAAAFTADGQTVRGKVVLNGALSADPEGEPLTYVWYDEETKIGKGIRFDYDVPPGTAHQIQLKVFDLGGLEGDSTVQTVQVPA